MSAESQAPPPPPAVRAPSAGPPDGQPPAPHLPEEVVVEHILARVPAAAAFRFRAVCRAWRDARTSDHFAEAHRAARSAAARAPEIVFFAPAPAAAASARPVSTAFYACKLDLTAWKNDQPSGGVTARELVTLRAADLIQMSTRPCRGLTLLSSCWHWQASAYHVCNLTTGEHVSLPAPSTRPAVLRSWPWSAGLGFDPAAREHKVARLYVGFQGQRGEVYGLKSGGWRPCAGQVPPANAVTGCAYGRPPVFVDGCFYWHIEPAPSILSLAVGTEQFRWVAPPGRRPVRSVRGLAELDGSLCAVVELDPSLGVLHEPELWTRTAGSRSGSGGSPPSWSLRCRVNLRSLPRAIRNGLLRGKRMLPLACSVGGKILLATSCHEVYAYDPGNSTAHRVFSVEEFAVAFQNEAPVLLNVALHEESVTGVRAGGADDSGQLEVKRDGSTLARRQGQAHDFGIISARRLRWMIDEAMR